jgi:hypothetical protein
MPNLLQDGEPLTYDWLNSLVQDIKDLQKFKDNTQKNSAKSQSIKVSGKTGPKASNSVLLDNKQILVKTGTFSIPRLELKASNKSTIKFSSSDSGPNAFAAPPLVVACLADDANDDKKSLYANIIVSNVTTTDFTIKINLISKLDQDTNLVVNYIAVGQYNQGATT